MQFPTGNPAAGSGGKPQQKPPQAPAAPPPAGNNPAAVGANKRGYSATGNPASGAGGGKPQAPAGSTLATDPRVQQLLGNTQRLHAQYNAAHPNQPNPGGAFNPANVTHTINGQRVALNPATGNVLMPGGNPALADANGQPTGATLQPTGAAPPPTYQQGLDAQFGQNNPFGQRAWYGDNPLETAQAVAQREFDKNLANIRSRFAAAGTGNSARQAIAEGTALGEFGTGLGDVLAQRGEGAFQNDATRGLQALLGAAGNQNQRDALGLQLNQQLGQYGTGLTGVGAQEQGVPNLGEILGLLTAFQSISGQGNNRSRGSSGFGYKN